MKCSIIIDKDREEEVVVYVHENNKFCAAVEQLCRGAEQELVGYRDGEGEYLKMHEVYAVMVEGGKTYAVMKDERLLIKSRLYQVEDRLPDSFVKINQSTIVNVSEIRRFDTSISGSLRIEMRNGFRDYVSRRCMKQVKEKMGV